MTIAQYLRLLREQWIAVALLALLGTLGAGAYSMLETPAYQAGAQLFVSTSGQGTLGEMTQGSMFTQARVKSYTDLLTSPLVLAPVIKQLSLATTPEELAGRVAATSPLDTVLINLTVTDPSPARAAGIANAISTQFPALVSLLETPDRQTVSPVKVTVTRVATPPLAPVSPRTALDLALGVLVGLGLGVGAAVLRDSLDRTVSSRSQVCGISGSPVLGSVGDDPDVTAKPLTTHDPFSPRAEAFRQLRTNIRFLSVDHRIGSLVVTGSVEAEGKTTTAANIAIALAQSGEHVVLVDADLRRPSVADIFGLPGGVGLTSVLLGDVPTDGALQRWRDDLPLDVLAAGPLPPNPSELIGSARMAELIGELTGRGMTVIVDSPPLLPVTDAAILARITDGALLVTRVASTRVDQFSAAVEALRTAGAPILGLVLNRVPRRGRSSSYYGSAGAGYQGSYPSRGAAEAASTRPAASSRRAASTGPAAAAGQPRPGQTGQPGQPAWPAPEPATGPRSPFPSGPPEPLLPLLPGVAAEPPLVPTAAAAPPDVLDAFIRPGAQVARPAARPAAPGQPVPGQPVAGQPEQDPFALFRPTTPPEPDLQLDLRDGAPAMAERPGAYGPRSAYAQHLAGKPVNGYLAHADARPDARPDDLDTGDGAYRPRGRRSAPPPEPS